LINMNQANCPQISVCIPTYRGAAHLAAAIESVLNQDFLDIELIIIDDNSPDNTDEIVSQFQDKRIRYIKNIENIGPEGNWNKCLHEAKGQYFKLLPQDDVLRADCLRRQMEVLEKDKEYLISLVFCSRYIIDSNEKIITQRKYPGANEGIVNSVDAIRKNIRMGTNLMGEPGAVLFRKSIVEKVGYFDGSISYIIDLDYWFRLLLHGNAYYINEPLVSFRVSSGSWSVSINNNQSSDFIKFINRCADRRDYNLMFMSVVMGKIMAKVNNYLRILFYKVYLVSND